MSSLDRRLHAFRQDLADARLRGKVDAERFAEPRTRIVAAPVADLLREPRNDAAMDTQFIRGDLVSVFDEQETFSWVQGPDGYVGYVETAALDDEAHPPTHVVCVPRTFVYPRADLRAPRKDAVSLGSALRIIGSAETRGTRYGLLDNGEAVIEKHLLPVETPVADFVAVAESLLGTPYLWGGNSGFGIDCSGLVQLSLRLAGQHVLRDTDMQETTIGEPVDGGEDGARLRRGDLVFWKGHVAIVSGPDEIIHASGHSMTVTREGLAAAIGRIGYLYGQPTAYRRP